METRIQLAAKETQVVYVAPDSERMVLDEYWGQLDVAPSTRATYQRSMQCFETWMEEQGLSILTATPADIRAYKDYLTDQYAGSTAQTYLVPVRSFYKWFDPYNPRPNPVQSLKAPRTSTVQKRDALTAEQARKTAGIARRRAEGGGIVDQRNYALFLLLLVCGLRTVEASRANVGDLIKRGSKTVLLVQGKGHQDKDDFVVVPKAVARVLRDYLDQREKLADGEPLFCSYSNRNRHEAITTRMISSVCKDILQEAGLDSSRYTAHSLRHTAITLALLAGASIQEVQALARHRSIETTQIYAHNLDKLNNPASTLAASWLEEL